MKNFILILLACSVFLFMTIKSLHAIEIVPEISLGTSENYDDHLGPENSKERLLSNMYMDLYLDFLYREKQT